MMLSKKYNLWPCSSSFKAFLVLLSFGIMQSYAQNILNKEFKADSIKTISIDGNQIFNISIETVQTDYISISSTLDGEYQNNYQIKIKQAGGELTLGLEFMSFEDIPDDKRNAHKVIAARLFIKIPKDLNLNVFSDIGSVEVIGDFKSLSIELLQGYCKINAIAKNAVVNTIDGKIDLVTDNAKIVASSKNGSVVINDFNSSECQWNLTSINGNITVGKQE